MLVDGLEGDQPPGGVPRQVDTARTALCDQGDGAVLRALGHAVVPPGRTVPVVRSVQCPVVTTAVVIATSVVTSVPDTVCDAYGGRSVAAASRPAPQGLPVTVAAVADGGA
ncbi:hypothetical protein GCM10010446_52130 [Streptomyces enissocaesilis]|uniref:Uncharacterized protein n=1 Tax=Streptomyces enissocaesilis TaxID=332589 RepID=A0ABN3XJ79_9ACTN